MTSFGSSLQHERASRGISLDAIASATKISARHLDALEQDQNAALPGGIFNRGIVQSYCRYLGLDEVDWLERYRQHHIEHERDWTEFAEAVKRNRTGTGTSSGRRWLGVLLMLAALAALGWGVWRLVIRPRVERPITTAALDSAQ
jgi:cytoskeleton protein RodZ